jgi:hypothetical protein
VTSATAGGNETADVVILDDVTPCYAAASETLSACNASLDAALQSLLCTLSWAKRARAPANHVLTQIRVNDRFA